MEKQIQSKSGRQYLHFGYETKRAVGSGNLPPSEVVPLQEGARLLLAHGIDDWWKVVCIGLTARKLIRAPFKKWRKRHGK